MSLDATKPTDQALISELAAYIRETRAAINAVADVNSIGTTDLEVSAGSTSLSIGSDLGSYGYETILMTAEAAVTLDRILGGSQGQVKVIVFGDNNVKLTDGSADSGKFYLNHLPALSDFSAQEGDSITLMNIGGDGGSTYGYWKEISRQIALK